MIRVTVWNEYYHETVSEEIRAVYPQGIHQTIADFLGKNEDMTVRTAVMDEPENGLTDEVLDHTDVLLWWSHVCHDKVSDATAERVKERILKGMGFIPLQDVYKRQEQGCASVPGNGVRYHIWGRHFPPGLGPGSGGFV